VYGCVRPSSDEEMAADELFDGEDKPECKAEFMKCREDAKKSDNKVDAYKKCVANVYACMKGKAKDKYACAKKCGGEAKTCVSSGKSKMDCFKAYGKCFYACKNA